MIFVHVELNPEDDNGQYTCTISRISNDEKDIGSLGLKYPSVDHDEKDNKIVTLGFYKYQILDRDYDARLLETQGKEFTVGSMNVSEIQKNVDLILKTQLSKPDSLVDSAARVLAQNPPFWESKSAPEEVKEKIKEKADKLPPSKKY